MAKQRVQVQRLPGPPKIVPQARPVDTFHRPDVGLLPQGPSEGQQLAEALSQFQPTLLNVAVNMKNRDNRQKMSEGEQLVLADQRYQTRRALGDAVHRGEIPAARNPAFLEGMRQQVYRLEGERYDVALRKAYAESNSRNEENITDFVSGFTSKFIEGVGGDPTDPELARILTPSIERSQGNLVNRHRAERDAALEAQVEENTETEIGLVLDRMAGDPNVILGSTSAQEAYAAHIHGIVQTHYENGLSGARSNEIIARAITRKAEEQGDTGYLDLLDQIPSGSGKVGQIGRVKDIRRATEERIYSRLEEQDRISSKLASARIAAETNAALVEGFNSLLADPKADLSPVLSRLSLIDPEAAQKLYGWQQSQINGQDNLTEDDDISVALTGKVFAGNGDAQEILDAHRLGLITKDTASKLMENVDRSKEFRSPLKDPTVNELHRSLGTTIRGSDSSFREADAINAARAQNQFLEEMYKFKRDNPSASGLDVLKYGRSLQKEMIDTYAKEAAQTAGDSVELTLETALIAAPESVDWRRKAIFSMDQIVAAGSEYNTSRGTSGALAALAAHLDLTVEETKQMYDAQVRLASAKPKPQP